MSVLRQGLRGNKFRDYLLVVEGYSRKLEKRLSKYACIAFKGCFVNGLIVYHLNVESSEALRRLKISLKKIEDGNCKVLKFEPLLKRDNVIYMVI